MYKLLRAEHAYDYTPAGIEKAEWLRAKRLSTLPAQVVVKFDRKPKPADFYWGLPPIFSAALLDELTALGADNLEACPVESGSITGLRLVNVVGVVSFASFVHELDLGELDRETTKFLEGKRKKLDARRARDPVPTALVTRMAEWNRPLLIRADLEARLSRFVNLRFESALRAGDFTGTYLETYIEEAAKGAP